MGQSLSQLINGYIPDSVSVALERLGGNRKRRHSSDDDEAILEESLHLPKRRKLICTPHYIYKALFIEGKNHDVVVDALGKEWKLHKLYLKQSPYFQSMFSGSWKETHKNNIKIEVADPNIKIDALTLVLGSLYLDEVSIVPASVVGVLAAATLFQLDDLIDQCLSVMTETISPLTATSYYEAATQYGLQRIKHVAIEWFLINLMTYYPTHTERLSQIGPDLMTQLVSHKGLVVVPTEFSLYTLLRQWVFLKLHPHWNSETDSDQLQISDFFWNRPDTTSFLLSPEGQEYMRVFQGLQVGSLLAKEEDIALLSKDRILPESWLLPELRRQWTTLLRIDSGNDKGPSQLASEDFFTSCIRLGHVLESSDNHTWRWKVFNYGLDLIWSTFNNVFTVRRSTGDNIALQNNRPHSLMLRVVVTNLDKQRQTKQSQSSGVITVVLVRNIEARIMDLSKELQYPMIVSLNLLSVSPAAPTAPPS